MSIIRSDNLKSSHPKPEWEHYRFLDSGTAIYRDYVDEAEVIATLSASDRRHKTVRINGDDYLIENDGVTFTLKGGGAGPAPVPVEVVKVEWVAAGGETTKDVVGMGVLSGSLMFGPIVMFEHTEALPVPANKYKYDSSLERIYFGTPLYAETEYIFVGFK